MKELMISASILCVIVTGFVYFALPETIPDRHKRETARDDACLHLQYLRLMRMADNVKVGLSKDNGLQWITVPECKE